MGDEMPDNPKVQELARRAMSGDVWGLAALGVWTLAGAKCQEALSDGVVSLETLVALTLNAEVALHAAGLLVEAGLWHSSGHACDRCKQPPRGSWVFHDWFQMRYSKGLDVRIDRGKRAELKDRKVTDAVWLRDRLAAPRLGGEVQASCRYCGKTVTRQVRADWQYDHVDPLRFIGAENIVIACKACNKQKMQRTPQEAGMVLHRPGWRPGLPDWQWPPETTRNGSGLVAGAAAGTGAVGSSPAETTVFRLDAGRPPIPAGGAASPAGFDASPSALPSRMDGVGLVAGAAAGTGAVGSSPAETTVFRLDAGRPPIPAGGAASPVDAVHTSGAPLSEGDRPPMCAAPLAAAASMEPTVPAAAAAEQVSTCARAGQGRVGQGPGKEEEGSGRVSGGAGQGVPASPRRKKRARRRGPDTSAGPDPVPADPGPEPEPPGSVKVGSRGWAGPAPEPHTSGEFGSPWFQWRGRPPEVDEAVCEEHGEHVPCRKCLREEWVNERDL